ncbi:hypothetical protein [Azospirillum sp. sgz302134]
MSASAPPPPSATPVLPIGPAAETLRSLALGRLPFVTPPADLSADGQDFGWLDDWIADDPPGEQRLLAGLLSRRLFGKAGAGRIPANMVTTRAARTALPFTDWRRRMKRFPALVRFVPPERRYVPDGGWRLAGTIAWSDPRFLHALGMGIRRRVRATGSPLDMPEGAVRPAPETFWLLCAALPDRRSGSPPSAHLTELALRLANAPGWAGVWEQWLIAEAISAAGSAAGLVARSAVARLLAQLPVFDRPAYRALRGTLGPPDPEGPSIAAPDWDAAAPPCLGTSLRAASTPAKKAEVHV